MKNKQSWRNKKIFHQPQWNKKLLHNAITKIKKYPNLVFIDEIKALKEKLNAVAKGEKFIVQAGDCAETFNDFSSSMIKSKIKIILQMSAIIQYTTKMDVVNIGRIAGQFAKPRTKTKEKRKNRTLPIYQGDAINDILFSSKARKPNPKRLLMAYHQSAATMNLIRSLMMEGFTDLNNIKSWKLSRLDKTQNIEKYNTIVQKIKSILQFSKITNMNKEAKAHNNNFFTSHEALILEYEDAFLELEPTRKKYYDCSSHMLWIGDRTRHLNGAHIEFASLLLNPIGIKIGPTFTISDILPLCKKLNPYNTKNKIILIIRLGEKKINQLLPLLINQVKKHQLNVLWMSDPMHGNTINSKAGLKTRNFNTIKKELEQFFFIHSNEGTKPGGVHFELTGEDVTECLGGMNQIKDQDLKEQYQTACDPRLNYEQSLEMAFLISDLLKINKTI